MTHPVNLTNLREMTGGDKEMEKELFEVFIHSSKESIDVLAASLTPETSETWRRQAHALKGISLSLGAEKLGELCKNAQESFQALKADKEKMLSDLKNEHVIVEKYLKQL